MAAHRSPCRLHPAARLGTNDTQSQDAPQVERRDRGGRSQLAPAGTFWRGRRHVSLGRKAMSVARRSWSLALAAVAGTIPSVAQAQGFGLNEIGSCAVGRGFTVVARPCADASTLFWNPAAMVRLDGLQVYGGAAAIGIGGDYTEDFTGRQFEPNVPTVVAPHLFA